MKGPDTTKRDRTWAAPSQGLTLTGWRRALLWMVAVAWLAIASFYAIALVVWVPDRDARVDHWIPAVTLCLLTVGLWVIKGLHGYAELDEAVRQAHTDDLTDLANPRGFMRGLLAVLATGDPLPWRSWTWTASRQSTTPMATASATRS